MSRGRGDGYESMGLRQSRSRIDVMLGPYRSWLHEQDSLPLGGYKRRSEVPAPPGYIVFDVETTGLDPNAGAKIIQLAMIELDPDGNQLSEFQTYLNPESDIDPSTIEIHGITNEMVASAPVFKEVWPQLRPVFNEKIWTAHNLRFDQNHLVAEGRRIGEHIFPAHGGACTFEASQLKHPVGGNKLADCIKRLGVVVDESRLHDASYDTWATAQLVQAMIRNDIAPESVYVDKNRFWRKRSLLQAAPLSEKDMKMLGNTLKRKRVDLEWAKRAAAKLDDQYVAGDELTTRQKQVLDDLFKFIKDNPRYEFLINQL